MRWRLQRPPQRPMKRLWLSRQRRRSKPQRRDVTNLGACFGEKGYALAYPFSVSSVAAVYDRRITIASVRRQALRSSQRSHPLPSVKGEGKEDVLLELRFFFLVSRSGERTEVRGNSILRRSETAATRKTFRPMARLRRCRS